ncbi:MAG: DUF4230 domain-containing protein [Spirochaetaceae bacterium]
MKYGKVSWILPLSLLITAAAGLAVYNAGALQKALTEKDPPASPALVERSVRSILELPTYEHIYHNIIYIGEEARFLWIKHLDKRLLFSIDITVQAGIDLTKGVTVTPAAAGGMRIGLPPPEILLVDAEESSIRQYISREFGGRFSRLEFYDEIDHSKEQTLQDALENGILDISAARAQALVENILSSLEIDGGYVYFRDPKEED